jgi:hypothetical protein
MLAMMEPPPQYEEEFHDWYDTEHLPQRLGLPGFLRASRWECIGGIPRWLARYDLASIAALESPEYLAVSGSRSTPWSRRMLAKCEGPGRRQVRGEILTAVRKDTVTAGNATHLLVARFPALDSNEEAGATMAMAELFAGVEEMSAYTLLQSSVETEHGFHMWALVEGGKPLVCLMENRALACGQWNADMTSLYKSYRRMAK